MFRQDGFVRGSRRDPWLRERAQFVNQTEEVANHEDQSHREGNDARNRSSAAGDVRLCGLQAQLTVRNGGEGASGRRSTSARGAS